MAQRLDYGKYGLLDGWLVYLFTLMQNNYCLVDYFFPGLPAEFHIIPLQVGSLDEANKAIYAGVDAIIVQGREAGGHVISQVRAFAGIQMYECFFFIKALEHFRF